MCNIKVNSFYILSQQTTVAFSLSSTCFISSESHIFIFSRGILLATHTGSSGLGHRDLKMVCDQSWTKRMTMIDLGMNRTMRTTPRTSARTSGRAKLSLYQDYQTGKAYACSCWGLFAITLVNLSWNAANTEERDSRQEIPDDIKNLNSLPGVILRFQSYVSVKPYCHLPV